MAGGGEGGADDGGSCEGWWGGGNARPSACGFFDIRTALEGAKVHRKSGGLFRARARFHCAMGFFFFFFLGLL